MAVDKEIREGVSFIRYLAKDTILRGYVQGVYREVVEVRFPVEIVQYTRSSLRKTWFFYEEFITSLDPGKTILDLSPATSLFGSDAAKLDLVATPHHALCDADDEQPCFRALDRFFN